MATLSSNQSNDAKYAAVAERVRLMGYQVPARGAWQKRAGAMTGSTAFDEALKEGEQWRKEENLRSLEGVHADS